MQVYIYPFPYTFNQLQIDYFYTSNIYLYFQSY